MPFQPWPAQEQTLSIIQSIRYAVILKARQLGFTWLCLAYALWLMLFRKATVLLFSKGDREAKDLMDRLVGMHERLPAFLRQPITEQNVHSLKFGNGAEAISFPTTGGRSYTAALAIVDEADNIPDLQKLLNAVKPTTDAGGQLILLSTPDKAKPLSLFKKIYQQAKSKLNSYTAIFFGWDARPGRTAEWYTQQKAECLQLTGALDDLHQEYPATDIEALGARTLDKRLAPQWIEQCYQERMPIAQHAGPAIPGLLVYVAPVPGHAYGVGADPAEGNPTSDDSAMVVVDLDTGEEVAELAGKFQITPFASYIDLIGRWYNNAVVLVERNNHGHAVLLWLTEHSPLILCPGRDGKPGWMTSTVGKPLLYSYTADALRNRETVIHTWETAVQLGTIEGASLSAPEGEHDDKAVAFALVCVLRVTAAAGVFETATTFERPQRTVWG